MKVAVVGATGMVGQVMLKVLEELDFPIGELIPVASSKSIGKEVLYKGNTYKIQGLETAVEEKADIAIFSAGGDTSLEWAPKFAEVGTTVIDNSSAWRMNPNNKLIVPEINASELSAGDKIIANPNCSTIQMVLALSALHKKYVIKRIVVSTYQSITGTGVKAVKQLNDEREGVDVSQIEMAYPYPIDKNCIPHCDDFVENGYTKEEMKLVNETKKIFNDPKIQVTATAVRVPVVGGHSEAINVEFQNDYNLSELRSVLKKTSGISVLDNVSKLEYPMPRFAEGKNDTFVGRLRRDESQENTLNMWVVADNLRKGAATNAVQIAHYLNDNGLLA